MKCTFYILDISKVAHFCKLSNKQNPILSTCLQNSIPNEKVKLIDGSTWELLYFLSQLQPASSLVRRNLIAVINQQQKCHGYTTVLRIHPPDKEVIDYKWQV